MNAETEVDFEWLEAAITADIKAQFPAVATVEFYREDRTSLPLPAILLELSEWEYAEEADPMTGQLGVIAHFEAEVVVSFRSVNGRSAKAEVRRLTAALAAWMHNRRWNRPDGELLPGGEPRKVPTGPVCVTGGYPDEFQITDAGRKTERQDKFEVWRLPWHQKVHLGKSAWDNSGTTPTTILLGESPAVGAGHEPDYEEVSRG